MNMVTSSDGLRIAVHDLGGSGPAVMFSHATGFLGSLWRPLLASLPGYHGYAIDYRAHGDSDAPSTAEGFAWAHFRDDLFAAVDGLDDPDGGGAGLLGVGHSMGGATLVMAELARPGTFRALALYEPVIVPPTADRATNPIVAGARRRRPTFPSREAALANFASKPPLDILTPEALSIYVEDGFTDLPDGTVTLKCAPEHEALTFENAHDDRVFAALGAVHCPVLILSGRDDPAGPASYARPVAAALPHATFEQLPALSHFGPMEDPPAVAGAIAGFFAG